MKKILSMLLVMSFGVTACKTSSDDPYQSMKLTMLTAVTLNMPAWTMLQVSHEPEYLPKPEYTWSSSVPSVATVDADGLIVARSGGVTIIRVTCTYYPTVYAECQVTITESNLGTLAFESEEEPFLIGENRRITVLFTEPVTENALAWTTDDPGIATVDDTGTVTAYAEGETVLRVVSTLTQISASCWITVRPSPVTGLELNMTAVTLEEGDSVLLIARVEPIQAAGIRLIWDSSDHCVTVDSEGWVKAQSEGKSNVSVLSADRNYRAECAVTVLPLSPKSIELNILTKTMVPGDEFQLVAIVAPENARNKNIVWSSSHAGVAVVDNQGKITAVEAGSAVISARIEEYDLESRCQITVRTIQSMVTTAHAGEYTESNGVVTGEIDLLFTNDSEHTLEIASLEMIDAATGTTAWSHPEVPFTANPAATTSLRVKIEHIYRPFFRWRYRFNEREYTIVYSIGN